MCKNKIFYLFAGTIKTTMECNSLQGYGMECSVFRTCALQSTNSKKLLFPTYFIFNYKCFRERERDSMSKRDKRRKEKRDQEHARRRYEEAAKVIQISKYNQKS